MPVPSSSYICEPSTNCILVQNYFELRIQSIYCIFASRVMSYGSQTVDVAMTQNELQWLCVLLEKKGHYGAKDASH